MDKKCFGFSMILLYNRACIYELNLIKFVQIVMESGSKMNLIFTAKWERKGLKNRLISGMSINDSLKRFPFWSDSDDDGISRGESFPCLAGKLISVGGGDRVVCYVRWRRQVWHMMTRVDMERLPTCADRWTWRGMLIQEKRILIVTTFWNNHYFPYLEEVLKLIKKCPPFSVRPLIFTIQVHP